MSNQTLLWSMFIIPWLTLAFMNRNDIKRYMPVGLFTALTSLLIGAMGNALKSWGAGETIPLFKGLSAFDLGALPVFTMWIFKFTYGRFWLYFITNAILDIGFAYLIFPWFVSRGILTFVRSSLAIYMVNTLHQIVLYGYQMWQEGIFLRAENTSRSMSLQPAAAKPWNKYIDNEEDDK